MNGRHTWRKWLLFLVAGGFTWWFRSSPDRVEIWYSQKIYPGIGHFLRLISGNIPFSAGDVLIGVLLIYGAFLLYHAIKNRRSFTHKAFVLRIAGRFVLVLGWVYLLFMWIWGLNYYREGSTRIFQVEPVAYSTADADTLVTVLQQRLQKMCADTALLEKGQEMNRQALVAEAFRAYQQAALIYPIPVFKNPSVKPMLLGPLQNYTGYAGYLLPFTGEANVNFYNPPATLPFTICHEMAHQAGFGSESEANLIGFLTAKTSEHTFFAYSAYMGVHGYALRELFGRDSTLAKSRYNQLPGYYLRDRERQQAFYTRYETALQPVLNAVYNLYLVGNNQPEGIESYNYIVAWLIAYGKKYGWDSL